MLSTKKKCGLMVICFAVAGIAIFLLQNRCPDENDACNCNREKVGFPHELHMMLYDCLECHHVYDDQKNNILDPGELYEDNPDIRCLSCHGPDAAIDTMTAFHRQCIGCHNREASAGLASGPNMCSGCHCREEAITPDYDMVVGN